MYMQAHTCTCVANTQKLGVLSRPREGTAVADLAAVTDQREGCDLNICASPKSQPNPLCGEVVVLGE
jgi:hypothetical protein